MVAPGGVAVDCTLVAPPALSSKIPVGRHRLTSVVTFEAGW